jgi:osmotically-inducible protein OsmY
MNKNYWVPLLCLLSLLSGCVPLIAATGIGAGAMVASDRRSAGTQLEDQTIETKASGRIQDKYGDSVHVSVTSFNRWALLTGEVPTEEIRKDLGALVLSVPNVRNVANELTIAGVTSFGSRSNDAILTTKVKSRLVNVKGVSSNHVKIVTENGVVYMMGLLTHKEAEAATDTTATTSGVQRVVKVFEYLD